MELLDFYKGKRVLVTGDTGFKGSWLVRILHLAGADWTYSSRGWAAENYCMFAADDEAWERIVRNKVEAVEKLGCKVWLNTE